MIGDFIPTFAWYAEGQTLVVALTQAQFKACFRDAAVPNDNSEEATWGRKLLREIDTERTKRLQDNDKCIIQITIRRYDDEPV